MRAYAIVSVWVCGCSQEEPKESLAPAEETGDSETGSSPADTSPSETSDTATADTAPTAETGIAAVDVLSASCELSENALRVDCTAALSGEGEAELVLTAAGAPERRFVSGPAVEHAILGYGLLPETTYDWSIGAINGTVTTGSLPPELAAADISVTGTSFGFDAVLYPVNCSGTDWFTLIDGEGRVVWYEPNDVFFFGSMTGYEWSQASRSVLSVNGDHLLEQHVSGEILLDLEAGVDFEEWLHHDTERWGDYRYLLFEYPYAGVGGGAQYVDGFHVFEGETLMGTFDLADHFTIDEGAGDWSHANGINVTEDGEVVLSLLEHDTVIGVDGDPASPDFLEVTWIAVGDEPGLPGATYTAIAGPLEGFDNQHNASRRGDELWLFDNLSQDDSRAARYLLDDTLGTITLDAAWSFDTTCSNQGGALPVDGGVLATCANSDLVWEFLEGSSTPDWTLSVDCGVLGGLDITRAIPVRIE